MGLLIVQAKQVNNVSCLVYLFDLPGLFLVLLDDLMDHIICISVVFFFKGGKQQ